MVSLRSCADTEEAREAADDLHASNHRMHAVAEAEAFEDELAAMSPWSRIAAQRERSTREKKATAAEKERTQRNELEAEVVSAAREAAASNDGSDQAALDRARERLAGFEKNVAEARRKSGERRAFAALSPNSQLRDRKEKNEQMRQDRRAQVQDALKQAETEVEAAQQKLLAVGQKEAPTKAAEQKLAAQKKRVQADLAEKELELSAKKGRAQEARRKSDQRRAVDAMSPESKMRVRKEEVQELAGAAR